MRWGKERKLKAKRELNEYLEALKANKKNCEECAYNKAITRCPISAACRTEALGGLSPLYYCCPFFKESDE